MTEIIMKLPEDIIKMIKDYVLTPEIRLKLFYQKHHVDKINLRKMLQPYTSKQLEQINWKYLYYKIYKISPPKCDNDNLVSIFHHVPAETIWNVYDERKYTPFKIYQINYPLYKYKLHTITRSNYYSENVHTEIGRKRQQYKNIIDGWKGIHEGQGTSKIPDVDVYMQNMEFELIRAIVLLNPNRYSK